MLCRLVAGFASDHSILYGTFSILTAMIVVLQEIVPNEAGGPFGG